MDAGGAEYLSEDRAVTLAKVCGFGILTTASRSFRHKGLIEYSRKMLQIVRRNAGSIGLNNVSPSLASELQHQKAKANTHDVKNGTLSDDESYVVRQGTEPNLLIAKAAGLEAFIPTAM